MLNYKTSKLKYNNTIIKKNVRKNLKLRVVLENEIQHCVIYGKGDLFSRKSTFIVQQCAFQQNNNFPRISQLFLGLSRKWSHKLQLKGTGYKLYRLSNTVIFKWGFSHLVAFKLPPQVCLAVEQTKINLVSTNLYLLKDTVELLKKIRKLNLYKGKGLYELSKVLTLKSGKVWQR